MKKISNLLLVVLVCLILPFQNVFALDVVIPPNNPSVNLSNNTVGVISPLSYVLEKPTLIVETLKKDYPWSEWTVTSRNVQYSSFSFMNGIELDESRCYVEDVYTSILHLDRTRTQYLYYITY